LSIAAVYFSKIGCFITNRFKRGCIYCLKNKKTLAKIRVLANFYERVMGIEPTLSAWKAGILPLNYTRISNYKIIEYSK
jgi:hypothetical protein